MKILFALLLFVQVISAQNYSDSSVVGYHQVDTLRSVPDSTGAVDDSISQFGVHVKFSEVDVIVKDTTGASAITDSLVAEVYDYWDGTWQPVAATDVSGDTTVTYLVPGNGTERRYTIALNNIYGDYFRVRRVNVGNGVSWTSGVKTIVKWVGK